MPQMDLICMANSRKHGGRCVAGLRTDNAGWVRPVGALPDGTLYPTDYMLSDYTEPGVLEVIRVGLATHRPAAHQPENWVIDGSTWGLLARPMPTGLTPVLRSSVTSGPGLLGGQSDRVAWDSLQHVPATASLALVVPDEVLLYHQLSYRGRRQVRGRFSLGSSPQSVMYDLAVTDPHWENVIVAHGNQTLSQTKAAFVLTISLGEPLGLFCYKLIAAVIQLPPQIVAAW